MGEFEPVPAQEQEVKKRDIALGVVATMASAAVLVNSAIDMYNSYNTENFDVNTWFTFTAFAITSVSTIVTYMMIDRYQEQKKAEQQPLE